jgi:hypothetical protein
MVNLRETKYVLSETKTTPKTTLLSTAPFRHLLAEPLTDRGNVERDSPESYWLWQEEKTMMVTKKPTERNYSARLARKQARKVAKARGSAYAEMEARTKRIAN